MTPEERQEINKQNSQRSTGPKTPEGKARSSKNAMKHGLTSKEIVLPNESAEEFEAAREGWIETFQPTDTVEMAIVDLAVSADWRRKRCIKSEKAKSGIRVRNAEDNYDLEQFARAERLGIQLLNDPIVRTRAPHLDPYSVKKVDDYRAVEHKILLQEMLTFAQGVDWLIARWERIGATLEREFFWHYPEKFEACRMLGIKIEDSFDDRLVAKIFLSCSALHPYAWELENDLQSATLGIEGRPNYALRIELLKDEAITDCDVAMKNLQDIYQGEIARLRELKATKLDAKDMANRLDTIEAAMFDDSKEGNLAMRYENARVRELRGALSDLAKKRKDEEARSEEKKPSRVRPNEAETPAKPRTAHTHRTAPPNEPTAKSSVAPFMGSEPAKTPIEQDWRCPVVVTLEI